MGPGQDQLDTNNEVKDTALGASAAECPLCGGAGHWLPKQLTGQQLRVLWKEMGHEFPSEAWGAIHSQFVVALARCQSCGFEFFDPALAGNQTFYHQLDQPGYYSAVRPEFKRTLQFAQHKGLKRILDVGCGTGIFLDQARQAGCQTYGMELSQVAAQRARDNGHQVFTCLLDQFDQNQVPGGFDLITLFQVLEHVPRPAQVLRQAGRLLSVGGYVAVAMPSETGIMRCVPLEPSQWPPHHVSRWRLADLDQLARAAGMKLVQRGRDLLLGSDIERTWPLQNRLAHLLGRPTRFPGGEMAKMFALAYRKTGMKFFFPRWGLSLYGYFQNS